MNRPVVVKIGGSTLEGEDTTIQDLVTLQRRGITPVVVHGGGRTISDWMERQGTRPVFLRGLRVTDASSLEIVTAVLAGLVNKRLVASLMVSGGKALGLSGVDGGLLEACMTNPALGYVGTITRVNPQPVIQALEGGFIPLIAPVGVHSMDASHNAGTLLNINGDTVAGELAFALNAQRLIFLTDVEGVVDTGNRLIPQLTSRYARMLLRSRIIRGGMIPKLEASIRALERVPRVDIIDGRRPGSVLACMEDNAVGTQIYGEAVE